MKSLSYSSQKIEQDDIDGVIEVLNSPYLTQGNKVKAFEEELCKYTGAKYAITFNSATSALFSAYTASSITKDDEIITSAISFVATSNMFVSLGAKPIWCDVKEDGNIDEEKIEALITTKTKAIVPVHFSGKPVEIEKIHAIAKKYNLLVIEDAAHALGSCISRQRIGSFSDMSIFSFHAIKPITTAEGGAILTDDTIYADKLRLIRSHGIKKKELWDSDMASLGYNFRLSEIAASLGITQIKKLDAFIQQRDSIAKYYDEAFKDSQLLHTLKQKENTKSSHHLYPIFLSKNLIVHKEEIFKMLQKKGLGVQVHYKPIYQNSFYKEKFGIINLANTNSFYESELSIPCHQKMDLDDAKYVVKILLETLQWYNEK